MIWIIGSLAYASVALTAARLLAGHFAWMFHANRDTYLYGLRSRPNGDQWFGAWCVAVTLAAIWPLVILPVLTSRRLAVGDEAAARAREQKQRIAELEQELGIK